MNVVAEGVAPGTPMQQSKRGAAADAEAEAQPTANKAKGKGDAATPAFDLSFGKAAKPDDDEDSGDADEPDADTSAGAVLTELIEMFKEKNGRDPRIKVRRGLFHFSLHCLRWEFGEARH